MRVRVTTKWDGERFRKVVTDSVNHGMTAGAMKASGLMRDGMGRHGRFTASPPGSPPNVRRGGLWNTITHTQAVKFRSAAGSTSRLGWVHETGNGGRPIRPVRAKFLPVPINDKAARRLETHGSVTNHHNGGWVKTGGLRYSAGPKLVPIRTKSGKLLLVHQMKTRTELWYVLKKEIRLPKRPWCVPAVDKNREVLRAAIAHNASLHFAKHFRGAAR